MSDEKEADGQDETGGAPADPIRSEPIEEAVPPNPAHEALAGALAKWDLVPASDFIRRR